MKCIFNVALCFCLYSGVYFKRSEYIKNLVFYMKCQLIYMDKNVLLIVKSADLYLHFCALVTEILPATAVLQSDFFDQAPTASLMLFFVFLTVA